MHPFSTRIILAALVATGGSAVTSPAEADGLDPAREITQYAHRAWTKRDGLPQNTVEAIAQTPDGYMWFGTVEGLARFDGTRFRTYNVRNTPHLELNYISALHVTRDSTMFIGNYGGMILRWRNGKVRQLPNPGTVERYAIRRIVEDRHGAVWVAAGSSLIEIRGDSIFKVHGVSDGLPHVMINSLCASNDGGMYVATPFGIWIRNNACFEPWMKGPEIKGENRVRVQLRCAPSTTCHANSTPL